jgi:hypothetical protein
MANCFKEGIECFEFIGVGQTNQITSYPSLSDTFDVKSKIVALLHTCDSEAASNTMSSNNSIIVHGTNKRKCILMAYQDKFGSEYPESIVTRKKGKISDDTSLDCTRMKPSLYKWYQIGDLQLLT